MPSQKVQAQIELAELIQSVDTSRAAGDPFKLPTALRTLVDTRLADLRVKDAATSSNEGERRTASANARVALDQLRNLLGEGYKFLRAIGSYAITEPERAGLFATYGWTGGVIGEFTDGRTEAMANLAVANTPGIANPAHRYPEPLMAAIGSQLATLNANQPIANSGNRQAAVDARDAALDLLQTANDRVRFFYCSASDDEDATSELARIGRQPRRRAGSGSGGGGGNGGGGATFELTGTWLPDSQVAELQWTPPAGAAEVKVRQSPPPTWNESAAVLVATVSGSTTTH